MNPAEANKIVYAKIAEFYDRAEPHFRPENKKVVKKILKCLRRRTGPRLLDIGCGTGFIIRLAKSFFSEIHGIDISPAMLARIKRSRGVTLHTGDIQKLPFRNGFFDLVTAYAVLHHLRDYKGVLREVYRVLKRNGHFYIDLEPNKKYTDLVSSYRRVLKRPASAIVAKEIRSLFQAERKAEEDYGIDGKIAKLAEYTKTRRGGIDPEKFKKDAEKIGFRDCQIIFNWYPGQGQVLHLQSASTASLIDRYLRDVLPWSQSLYKYLRIFLKK